MLGSQDDYFASLRGWEMSAGLLKVYTCAASPVPEEEQSMDQMLLFADPLRAMKHQGQRLATQ